MAPSSPKTRHPCATPAPPANIICGGQGRKVQRQAYGSIWVPVWGLYEEELLSRRWSRTSEAVTKRLAGSLSSINSIYQPALISVYIPDLLPGGWVGEIYSSFKYFAGVRPYKWTPTVICIFVV
ncbi:hypothetical protein D9613_009359 [Agrocybe pediades]|uniref:Uncharacterized protein n=1 Tax=Agrocybe pediades TaxID=84607 RepID=A0A8H4R316_9AGAR|nr:hypothetical protein D9613_009359 [Agrocybe pediades]